MNAPKSIPRREPKKPKQPVRVAEVVESIRLTPNMQRIILSGDELLGFPPNRDGANFKIMVPKPNQNREEFSVEVNNPSGSRTVRTYTISKYDEKSNQLIVDFALHDGSAPAGDWAKTAKIGSFLGVTNGGAKKVNEFWGSRHVIAADMTALPAIEALLREMPKDSKGDAFFEVTHPKDKRDMGAPIGFNITWLVHADPHVPSTAQVDNIRRLNPDPNTQVTAAGEHSVIAALKDYFFVERNFDPAKHYLSPYWKIGLIEDEHQDLKRSEK